MHSTKGASGSRRSALEERLRLRAEWAAIKEADNSTEVLRGVVALVEVGPGSKALALRAALTALGASVVQSWGPLVTHVVWAAGGCRKTRAKARALACRLVSPLWVEGCAAANKRLPETAFPAATRPSDLPSPATLKRLLKAHERENATLELSDELKKDPRKPRLRLSSEHENDTSLDTSKDTSTSSTEPLPSARHVTVPPKSHVTNQEVPTKKSRRKLFTYKEGADETLLSEEEKENRPMKPPSKMTQKERRDLARAERMARKLANGNISKPATVSTLGKPRIVLSGMSNAERRTIFEAIKKLNGKVQNHVNKKTTHIILGSCCDDDDGLHKTAFNEITGIESLTLNSTKKNIGRNDGNTGRNIQTGNTEIGRSGRNKVRTLNALEGAVRGCRVLAPLWVIDSVNAGQWIHPIGYEIPHLKKVSQKARIERAALRQIRTEYAYDVFCGIRVQISPNAENRQAATKLLTLCGAKLVENDSVDLVIGVDRNQISSKWVFDSVMAGRMRNTRRYVIHVNNVNVKR